MRYERGTKTKTISLRVPEDLPSGEVVRKKMNELFIRLWNGLSYAQQKQIQETHKEQMNITQKVLK